MSSFFKAMEISSSGLAAQRTRLNILSSNLANAQTTRSRDGSGPYRRQDVIFSAVPTKAGFEDYLDNTNSTQLRKVKVVDIHKDQAPHKQIFNPTHADADENGFVKMPNIEVMTEMVNMIMATRAYEANATALDSSKNMALKAIEIGR